MTATLAVRINISLLRITFSLVKFFVSSLRSRPVLSTVDAFGIVTPLGRVNKPGPGNFAFNFPGWLVGHRRSIVAPGALYLDT